MSYLDLQNMKWKLIQGGVAPKFVKRTLAELRAHYADLRERAIKDGLTESQANDKARQAIGDEREITEEILRKPELKTFTSRFPKTVFLFGPLSLAISALALLALILFILASSRPWFSDMGPGTEIAIWEKILLEGLLIFNCYLVTPLLAIGTVLLAKQRLINFHWPAFGIVLLTVLGSGWAYSLDWPTEVVRGTLQINWGYSFLPAAIRGDHDLQNYIQIFTTLALATFVWRIYKPYKKVVSPGI